MYVYLPNQFQDVFHNVTVINRTEYVARLEHNNSTFFSNDGPFFPPTIASICDMEIYLLTKF